MKLKKLFCGRLTASEEGKGCPRCGGKVFEAEKVGVDVVPNLDDLDVVPILDDLDVVPNLLCGKSVSFGKLGSVR